jgi:hypothetical protein
MQKLLDQSEKNLSKEFDTSANVVEEEEESEVVPSVSEETDDYGEYYDEESYISSDDEPSEVSSVAPDPLEIKWHHKLFATRTIKGAGADGADLPPWWMNDYGEHGQLTTEEVMEKYKKKMKTKEKALAKIYRRQDRRYKREEEREQARLRKHYFDVKVNRLKREKGEKIRITEAKIKAEYNRKISESRVYNLLVIGREGAIRKKKADAAAKKKADDIAKRAKQDAYMRAKKEEKIRKDKEAEAERKLNEIADNLMRRFGVMEGRPKNVGIKEVVPKVDDEQIDLHYGGQKDMNGINTGNACLSVDLTEYPYLQGIKCYNLGKYGAKELAGVISPKQVLGTTETVAGACEGLLELSLAGNKILAQGINDIRKGLLKGGLPRLKILKLDGNQFGCTGARCIAECIEQDGCLKHLTYLSMRENSISDFGGIRLATAFYKGLTIKLEELDLSQNLIRRGGVIALTRALQTNPYKKAFKTLRLRNNRLKVSCLRKLAETSPPFLIF